jgi:hypothetical protein
MSITVSQDKTFRRGGTNNFGVSSQIALDNSYPTGGYTVHASDFALSAFHSFVIEPVSGYNISTVLSTDGSTAQVLVYEGSATGTTSSTSAGTPAGTNSASTSLDYSTPVFSGTGQASAGQVITTTDNQTMTLNQCAGMWFVSATHGPYLIASNTAVTGAPAVLTIYGTAPTTDAGTYKILKNAAQTFSGSALAGHTHTFTATAGTQVPNGTDLSALTGIQCQIEGL